MPNTAQSRTYALIREEISRLRGPQSYVPLPLEQVSELQDCPNPREKGYLGKSDRGISWFRINGSHVFLEEDGNLLDAGMPDCPRYSSLVTRYFLHAVAADLLRNDSPHKPFLDINSHTPESFENYLKSGIPLPGEYPFPIAIVSRKMGNEANGMRSFFLLLDLFEVIVRFIVVVQLADYMRASAKTQSELLAWCRARSKKKQNLKFSTLYLGDWKDLFCALPQFPSGRPFLKELRVLKFDQGMLEHFVKLRNDLRGHGNTQGEAYYRSIFEENVYTVTEFLHSVRFLKRYWLLKPISITRDTDSHCEFSAWKLTGDNPSFDKRNLRSRRPLTTGRIIYLNSDLEPLELDPFVIVETCKKCDREELLLYDGFFGREINYLGYESCPESHKSRYPYVGRLPPGMSG